MGNGFANFATSDGRPNVLVIVSDTFRRDNLSDFGGDPAIAPHLNRLASESTVFERFYSCSFPTVPARADLLTGRIAFTRQGWGPLESSWGTIAEMASAAGYKTMCVTDVPFLMRSGFGYDRGFSDYIWVRGQPDRLHPDSSEDVVRLRRVEGDHCAPSTMRLAAEWLERQASIEAGGPFFLVADTWDPHEPWDAPEYYARRFMPEFGGGTVPYPPYERVSGGSKGSEVQIGRAAYLGKTRMTDYWIGFLLSRLEETGLAASTVVFFLTDHGFYFGEHGFFGKSIGWRIGPVSEHRSAVGEMGRSPLYEEVCHIPLLVRVPGAESRREAGLACMPDVAASICDLMGQPAGTEGRSLVSPDSRILRGARDFVVTSWPMHLPGEHTRSVDSADRTFSGFMPMTLTTQKWSMLYASSTDSVELYDLEEDPQQTDNVATAKWDVVRDLHSSLLSFLREAHCPDRYLSPRASLGELASEVAR